MTRGPSIARVSHRLSQLAPYSYRTDPAVPAFPDDKALIVFDGVCVLCSRLVQFAIKRDPDAAFKLCTVQSEIGQALFRHYGLDTNSYETNLVLVDGRAYGKLDSVAVVVQHHPECDFGDVVDDHVLGCPGPAHLVWVGDPGGSFLDEAGPFGLLEGEDAFAEDFAVSVEEAGDALGLSRATAFRDWAYARAWLTAALAGD